MRRSLRAACLALAFVPPVLPRAETGAPSRAEASVGGSTLSVPVPAGFGAGPVPRGLLIRPLTQRRAPYDVAVTMEDLASPAGDLPRLHRHGPVVARYRLDREEGGSGGEEVTLTAERACEGITLRLVLRMQAEIRAASALEPAWAMLRGAGCRRDGAHRPR